MLKKSSTLRPIPTFTTSLTTTTPLTILTTSTDTTIPKTTLTTTTLNQIYLDRIFI